MSLASVAAQQNAPSAAATSAGTSGTTTTTPATSTNPLASLSDNFNTFLNLLLTQLQNQDPTSPVDTDQFTQELVEFSSVEQQINTNGSLQTLIQLGQSQQVEQGSAIVGKQVVVSTDQLPLQDGSGTLSFTAPAAGPAIVSVYNNAGVLIDQTTVQAKQGANSWTWNGEGTNGQTYPDGAYKVGIAGVNASGQSTPLPFTVTGTVTGVSQANNQLQVQVGPLNVGFGQIQSVGG